MRRALLLLSFIMMLFVGAGCHHPTVVGPTRYENAGIVLVPQEFSLSRGKLWVKLTLINQTTTILYVDRNQLMVRLADGSTRARAHGTWAGMANGTHVILPGTSHNVYVEFEVGDVPPGDIHLVLHGLVANGAPLVAPDYVLTVGD